MLLYTTTFLTLPWEWLQRLVTCLEHLCLPVINLLFKLSLSFSLVRARPLLSKQHILVHATGQYIDSSLLIPKYAQGTRQDHWWQKETKRSDQKVSKVLWHQKCCVMCIVYQDILDKRNGCNGAFYIENDSVVVAHGVVWFCNNKKSKLEIVQPTNRTFTPLSSNHIQMYMLYLWINGYQIYWDFFYVDLVKRFIGLNLLKSPSWCSIVRLVADGTKKKPAIRTR